MSVLALGQAFGRVPMRWSSESLALTPIIHDQARVNAVHAHEGAFVTMMLGGEYSERAALRSLRFERFSAVYHPPAVEHQDSIGGPGVRLLMFEFRTSLVEDLPVEREGYRSLRDLSGSLAAWALLKLYRDAGRGTDPLDFEDRAMELVAQVVPFVRTAPRDRPSLARARDYLHGHFRDRMMMQDVARAAGIHPVYLGQAFRREFGETIGSYVARLRVSAAARQLSDSDAPIAGVAFDHGFCDQSHFQRVFKQISGFTPREFRSAFRAR